MPRSPGGPVSQDRKALDAAPGVAGDLGKRRLGVGREKPDDIWRGRGSKWLRFLTNVGERVKAATERRCGVGKGMSPLRWATPEPAHRLVGNGGAEDRGREQELIQGGPMSGV